MIEKRTTHLLGAGLFLLGILWGGCASTHVAKVKASPDPTPPETKTVEPSDAEKKPLPPRPRPYFGPPPSDFDPLSGTHENLFDPLKLGQPQICCPIHGLNPPPF